MASLQAKLQVPTTACLAMLSIASLQQEKAAAVEVAAQCKSELEETNVQLTTLRIQTAAAEARMMMLEGLLQTESSEANNLRDQLTSQAEVCPCEGGLLH